MDGTSVDRGCLKESFRDPEELVEAAGVEPASEKARRAKPTCVAVSVSFTGCLRKRQERQPTSPIDLDP